MTNDLGFYAPDNRSFDFGYSVFVGNVGYQAPNGIIKFRSLSGIWHGQS